MAKKVFSGDLKVGMFVADLDRPWIDTPFLLQGFLVEDDEQIRELRKHCEWVIIDPLRSVGDAFEAPPKKAPPVRRDLGTDPIVTVHSVEKPSPKPQTTQNSGTPTKVRPEPVPPKNPTGKGGLREFAISTKDAKAVGTRSTALEDEASMAPYAREPQTPESGDSGGLWGQLRQGFSGLFSKKEKLDDSKVAYIPPPPQEAHRPSFLPESVQLVIYEDKQPVEEEIGAATVAFEKTNELLTKVVADIRGGRNLQLESVEDVIEDMVDSMVRNPDALMWVARMREKDLTVYDHGLAVAVSLVAFGRHLGYPKAQLAHLGMVGLLLDIGKIKIPRDLLEKHAQLTPAEFDMLRNHVPLGLEILDKTPNIHPDVLLGIAQHHERMNGSGYPRGVPGEKISVYGKMAGIADTFSAVTKERPYAKAISPHEALQMLSNWSGAQFHGDMVEQFIQSIGVFPVGSLVELSTGEVAVVVTHNKLKRLRPRVLVVTAADKTPEMHPAIRDLLYDVSERPAHIRRGLPSNAFGIDPNDYYLT